MGINGFVQTTKVLNKINHLSYELDIISEELVKENVDKKIFPLYGNPYYLNDIAIKNKSFYTKRCSKDFLSPDIQHKGVLLIHSPSFDCSIYNDNLGNYKKISSYSFDVKHFLPGYFFSNINTYKYSSYLPDEWVTTFPVDLNKNIVKYMLDIYVPKD